MTKVLVFFPLLLLTQGENKLVDRVYYPIKQLKNWTEARDYCRGQYTDLVSIRSAQEANRTSQLIVSDRTHWIGLFSKKGSAATWTWTDGEDVNYTHWKYMEPNDYLKSDICVAVNNGRWFDDYCNRTYQFMCYKVNRMYYLIAQEKNWTEALIYCRIHYTNLISIQSYEDDMFISQKFDSNVPLWIGLYNKKGSRTNWMWTNEERLNYSHWKYMEPNGYLSSPVCVAVSKGLWFDDFCNQTYQFICQKGKIGKRV
uniref:C-type lectin domain-containing protein n=1 Tax=Callorhinchus milii TaxID=7868 RepID=A0A4W3IDM3_CALMI